MKYLIISTLLLLTSCATPKTVIMKDAMYDCQPVGEYHGTWLYDCKKIKLIEIEKD